MTIRELYDWAVEQHIEDYDITVAYADGGGFYSGNRYINFCDIEINRIDKEVEI